MVVDIQISENPNSIRVVRETSEYPTAKVYQTYISQIRNSTPTEDITSTIFQRCFTFHACIGGQNYLEAVFAICSVEIRLSRGGHVGSVHLHAKAKESQMKRKLSQESPSEVLIGQSNEPTPREFGRFPIATLNRQHSGGVYRFHLSKSILHDDFNGWLFVEHPTKNLPFEMKVQDESGTYLYRTGINSDWITDRNILLKELRYRIDFHSFVEKSECKLEIICRTHKLPEPIIHNRVFAYDFYDTTNSPIKENLEWRRKDNETWKQYHHSNNNVSINFEEKNLNIFQEDEVIQFRRYDRGVFSDIFELQAPWLGQPTRPLPLELGSLILHGMCVPLSELFTESVSITQEEKLFANCEPLKKIGLRPGVPFRVTALHKCQHLQVVKDYGTHVIPLPFPHFNHQIWKQLIQKHPKAKIVTDTRTSVYQSLFQFKHGIESPKSKENFRLDLSSKGYFRFGRETKKTSIMGYFSFSQDILSEHLGIEFSPFPKKKDKPSYLLDESSVHSQEHSPLPLRNRDLLNLITSFMTKLERQNTRGVCKQWARDVRVYPAEFRVCVTKKSLPFDPEEEIVMWATNLHDLSIAIFE